jgi:DNA gyrase subunit B
MHPKFKMPAVELVLTNLHAGGKFGQGAYKYSGGLHGVGAKCVNALSDWFKVEVSRDGKVYHMGFERGKTTQKLEVIGELKNKKQTGTLITFLPDATIFTITIEFKFERLAYRLRELAFLNPGLEITLDGRTWRVAEEGDVLLQARHRGVRAPARREQDRHSSEAGHPLAPARRSLRRCRDAVQRQLQRPDPLLRELDPEPGRRHASHRFPQRAHEGGNQYAKANSLIKEKDPAISGDDVREGLTCVLSIKLPNPRFESQTKVKLVNTEIDGIVNSVVYEGLMTFFDQNPPSRSAFREGAHCRTCARSGAQSARDDPQGRAHRRRLARQARRLLRARSGSDRALHRRG